ncbi:MAG TPA: adenylate/guanylate cyclase domain-containing protein [Bacteroidales bacterium]|nr:adenylate/guanylate cyclase domain-containing protein [Bacteroidales bacterium]HNS47012.1 adenylate/guanylate cyclase domain-containing protein [Bacteroidales bacterium]
MRYSRVPRYYGFRIYLISTVIFYLLITPFIAVLALKYAPQLIEKGELRSRRTGSGSLIFSNDSLIEELDSLADAPLDTTIFFNPSKGDFDTVIRPKATMGSNRENTTLPGPVTTANEKSPLTTSLNLMLKLLLVSFILGFVFNLPFKRYFIRKRKNKKISRKLFLFTKKYLLLTPLINSGILTLAYLATTIYMIVVLSSPSHFSDDTQKQIFSQFFYVSIVASVLVILFVYFWQKHRVHIKYLEHVFTAEELRRRIFNFKVGKIRNRFLVSSIMTTLLPLTIVILYLFLSLTPVADLEEITPEQVKILLGDYTQLFGFPENIDADSPYRSLYYINAIDNISMFIGIGAGIFVSFIYIILFVRWTTQDIASPVSELLENMRLTGEGKLNNFGIVRTNDEIGQLTEGYNEMSQKIKDYIHNISRMNLAYSRFIPQQFLDFLGKESFVDIKLGDQVQQEMTILFTDIRRFTDLSESMTPKENFDFLNHYLGYMEPVIRNNNGFIDKYMGDSIMALFPENPGDAINASIEMRIKLAQFNQVMGQFGKPEIDSGIGIHIGKLMLGVVGGEGRMDGTVISDAVNLASRLENLTKIYGCAIIISEDTLIKLDDPSAYNYRFLDIVKVKGKKQAVYIFEVLDGEPEDIKRLKIQTKAQFAKAINYYKNKDFQKALEELRAIHEVNMHDKAAVLYINRCAKMLRTGIPSDWDGIEVIDSKG